MPKAPGNALHKIETVSLAPDLDICRILNGMWQVAGGHGQIDIQDAVSDMTMYDENGFKTWDMADIYGPAEDLFGAFQNRLEQTKSSEIQVLTKFVPNPGTLSKSMVEHFIDQSRKKMHVESIDVLQFHWWDYSDLRYLDVLNHLKILCDEGKIRYLGLTNFDTQRMKTIVEHGFRVVSNQVQFSILDQRPETRMIPFCQKHGIKLLAYGTLLGGFLSERFLNADEPTRAELDTQSLQKYKNMIDAWGGWKLFQSLLKTLSEIGQKYGVSIPNVATRFVLNRPCVAGVIIGTRLGISEHRNENCRVFEFDLDTEDCEKIESVTAKSENLFDEIGDCGAEYR